MHRPKAYIAAGYNTNFYAAYIFDLSLIKTKKSYPVIHLTSFREKTCGALKRYHRGVKGVRTRNHVCINFFTTQ